MREIEIKVGRPPDTDSGFVVPEFYNNFVLAWTHILQFHKKGYAIFQREICKTTGIGQAQMVRIFRAYKSMGILEYEHYQNTKPAKPLFFGDIDPVARKLFSESGYLVFHHPEFKLRLRKVVETQPFEDKSISVFACRVEDGTGRPWFLVRDENKELLTNKYMEEDPRYYMKTFIAEGSRTAEINKVKAQKKHKKSEEASNENT